jgi:hypothetical protein
MGLVPVRNATATPAQSYRYRSQERLGLASDRSHLLTLLEVKGAMSAAPIRQLDEIRNCLVSDCAHFAQYSGGLERHHCVACATLSNSTKATSIMLEEAAARLEPWAKCKPLLSIAK